MKELKSHFSKTFCFILVFTGFFIDATAQAPRRLGLEPDEWATVLAEGSNDETNSLGRLTREIVALDSLRAVEVLDSIENSKNAKGYLFRAIFCMVKADVLFAKYASYDKYKDRRSETLKPIKEQLMKLYEEALDAANHTDNELTIGWVNYYSAQKMIQFGDIAWGVMYSKNGVDIFEKEHYPIEPPVYTGLAELLCKVKEYDESILYAKKGLAAWKTMNYEKEYDHPYLFKIRALNAIGRSFYETNRYDSASTYYQMALDMAIKNNDTLLIGRAGGNIGRIIYTQNNVDSAWVLFQSDYGRNKKERFYDEAAHASQWMAKVSLARGNKVGALAEAKEAVRLLALWPNRAYLRDTYYTLMQVFKAMGNYDSAFYYSDRYRVLNDSLEREVATSSLAISKARLSSELSRYKIQKINKQKQEQLFIRNVLMAAIVALFLIVLLVINRGRLKQKVAVEKAEKEKMLMEQEIRSAKEQMHIFTTHAIEKTNLIEKLELQIKDKEATTEQAAILSELMQHTILTEDDWIQFKMQFEKIYPAFFQNLKQTAADITVAEQRMAALTRLQLTSKQMAAMLGISVDSVHKTRQRLRQRLQLSSTVNLDEYIAGI